MYDALLGAGATNFEVWRRAPHASNEPPAEDRGLVYLCSRREPIEWALRKAACSGANVTVRARTVVTGLLGGEEPVPVPRV